MDRKGHPLPRSKEARHNEIPEHLVRDKGRGDDSRPVLQPSADPVTPEGEPYRYGDLGRGPDPIQEDEKGNNVSRDEAARASPKRAAESNCG